MTKSNSPARQVSFLDEGPFADHESEPAELRAPSTRDSSNQSSAEASSSEPLAADGEGADASDTLPKDRGGGEDAVLADPPFERLKPTVVRASAGTGKTYQLTARLFKILLQGAEPDSVLATTFTRKAAGEILDRLLLALANAADPDNPAALASLRAQVEIPSLQRKTCLQLLQRLLREIHRLRICTLDSLFSQLARALPFELSLPPNWRLTDDIEEVWLRERAVTEVIRGLKQSELASLLGMLGKGDVRRSVSRELIGVIDAAYAAQRQCGRDAWLQITVPRLPDPKQQSVAAADLRRTDVPQKRLRTKLDQFAECLELHDFADLVEQTLTQNIAKAKRTKSSICFGNSKLPDELSDACDVVYRAARSEALKTLRTQNEATETLLSHYDQHVTRIKLSLRAFGFDDIALRLAEYFNSFDVASLVDVTEGAIDHLLLDEFQDTSPVQWQVLRPIATRAASESFDEQRTHRSFFCVGDQKQAIYGWRGGVAEIFGAVSSELDVEEQQQDKSFRSSPIVIDAVNRVFRNLRRHPLADPDPGKVDGKSRAEGQAIREFVSSFPEHTAHRDTLPGHVTLATSPIVRGDAAARKSGLLHHAADRVEALHASARGRSIGVLTRTNSGVAEMIHLLDSRGVDVSQEGGNPLTDSAAVEVVLSALMLAEHPADLRWSYHVASTPLACALALEDSDSANRAAARVRRRVEDFGIAEAVEWFAGVLAPTCDRRDTIRLRQLVQLAIQYEPYTTGRTRDFVRLVREKRVERPRPAPVRVMTVHQAKGLEFDAVVLVELDQSMTGNPPRCVADVRKIGEPPTGMSRYVKQEQWHFLPQTWQRALERQAASAINEAICLLYVAMTRARHALHMIILPASNKAFASRSAAALVYHGSLSEEDPTRESTLLFESGDSDWSEKLPAAENDVRAKGDEASVETSPLRLSFKPSRRPKHQPETC